MLVVLSMWCMPMNIRWYRVLTLQWISWLLVLRLPLGTVLSLGTWGLTFERNSRLLMWWVRGQVFMGPGVELVRTAWPTWGP